MPPISQDVETPFRVLVTGFGPFRTIKNNPSYELASKLDGVFMTADALGTSGRSVLISTLIPSVDVIYQHVLTTVPELHRLPYDLILHIGAGLSDAVYIEEQAHKLGYELLDEEQQCGPQDDEQYGFVAERYKALDDVLQSKVDVATVVSHLQKEGWQHLRHSRDPGRFLCDFIYYASLAEAKLATHGRAPLVLFVHVPSHGTDASGGVDESLKDHLCPYTMSDLQSLLKAIIWQVASRSS